MAWAEISLSVERAQVPEAEDVLEAHGALAVTLLDRADDPVLEPPPGEAPLWPTVEVRALFPQEVDRDGIVQALRALSAAGAPAETAWSRVEDRDWERAWMDRFRPMRFGRALWIVPTGMEAPAEAGTVLHLDPGLAFGTGTHPTTALCLEWIDGQSFAGRRVLDYGCGSGVLGIAAALKGAERVCCVDNDPQALMATAANAERNGVSERVRCLSPEAFQAGSPGDRFDFVLANILAAPLIGLAGRLCDCLDSGGRIVLSGILESQSQAVAAAYRSCCSELRTSVREGWVRLAGLRKAAGSP